MIRNRISAQKSRDNRKMYIQSLQATNKKLNEEIDILRQKSNKNISVENSKEQQNQLGLLKEKIILLQKEIDLEKLKNS